jgi:hypothetical protein
MRARRKERLARLIHAARSGSWRTSVRAALQRHLSLKWSATKTFNLGALSTTNKTKDC